MTKMKSYIECSICSDRFGLDEANDEVVTPCGHVYHGSCLNKWIQRSSAATCPECRNPTMMNNCRRIYFRYSNDSDSAQSHIDYLSKELAKKTMDLQNERSAKKKVEQDYGAQMKEMEYTIGKLKLKLKERKQQRRMDDSQIIQNNAIFHNLINMSQNGIFPPVQSSNTGTVPPINPNFMGGASAMHYVNIPSNKHNQFSPFMSNPASMMNMNHTMHMNNQWQQHTENMQNVNARSQVENWLNANASAMGGSSGSGANPAHSSSNGGGGSGSGSQRAASAMIPNQIAPHSTASSFAPIDMVSSMSNNTQSYSSRPSRRQAMPTPITQQYDSNVGIDYSSQLSYQQMANNAALNLNSNNGNFASMSAALRAPIVDFIDLDAAESSSNVRSAGPSSGQPISAQSSTSTRGIASGAPNQQQQTSASSSSAPNNNNHYAAYEHLVTNQAVDNSSFLF